MKSIVAIRCFSYAQKEETTVKWIREWQEYGIPEIAWLIHDIIIALAFVTSIAALVMAILRV